MQASRITRARILRLWMVPCTLVALLGACQRGGDPAGPASKSAGDQLPAAQPIDMGVLQTGAAPSGGDLQSPYGTGADAPSAPPPAGGGAFNLDPSQAMNLKPLDELKAGAEREGVISFSRLSLAGTDIEALLDHIFEKVAPPYTYPEEVQALDGQDIKLVGYMIPLTWKEREVTEFMLVRDLASCCFGGIPRPDEWAFVAMAEGEACEYFPYVPVLVSGPFTVYPLDAKGSAEESAPQASEDAAKTSAPEGTGDVAAPEGPEDPMDVEAVFSLVATKVERY